MQFRFLRFTTKGIVALLALFLFSTTNYAQNCNQTLVHYDLDACASDDSYDEYTADTDFGSNATGSASIFSNMGHHSCTPGAAGNAMCHAIMDGCDFMPNNPNAYRFSVDVNPAAGFKATISGLSFFEAAPLSYLWLTGQTGDNDPPSKYGIRVMRDGAEIFRMVDVATSESWSMEEFDFSGMEFMADRPATFTFELLGYCRQTNSPRGFAVWDVDEIKVHGCIEEIKDCPNLNADIGDSCDDGDANTTNDVVRADCTCAGTPIPPPPPAVDCPTLNANIGDACNDGNANTINDVVQANCTCAGTPVGPPPPPPAVDCPTLNANIGDACNDGNPNTTNDVVQANCTCAGTPVGPPPPPGGPGCDANYTVTGNEICATGLNDPFNSFKVLDMNGGIIYSCNNFMGGAGCGTSNCYTVPADGKYFVQIQTFDPNFTMICNIWQEVIIGTPPPNPFDCIITATVSNVQCDGSNTFSFDVTANIVNGGAWGWDIAGTNIMMNPSGTTVTVSGNPMGNGTTTFTVFDHDKPSCTTTISVNDPAGPCTGSIVAPNNSTTCEAEIFATGNEILVSGLNNPHYGVKVIDGSWNVIYECTSWDSTCDGTEAEIVLSEAGTYYVSVVTHTDSWVPLCRLFEKVEVADNQGLEVPNRADINIFPNPAENNLNLRLMDLNTNAIDVLILNQVGGVVKSYQFDQAGNEIFNLNIEGLKNGVYTVVVLSQDNNPITKRLVVGKSYYSKSLAH